MKLKVKDNDKIVAEGWGLGSPLENLSELVLVVNCRLGDRNG